MRRRRVSRYRWGELKETIFGLHESLERFQSRPFRWDRPLITYISRRFCLPLPLPLFDTQHSTHNFTHLTNIWPIFLDTLKRDDLGWLQYIVSNTYRSKIAKVNYKAMHISPWKWVWRWMRSVVICRKRELSPQWKNEGCVYGSLAATHWLHTPRRLQTRSTKQRVFSSGNVHKHVKEVPSPVAKETMVRREEMNDACLRQWRSVTMVIR